MNVVLPLNRSPRPPARTVLSPRTVQSAANWSRPANATFALDYVIVVNAPHISCRAANSSFENLPLSVESCRSRTARIGKT